MVEQILSNNNEKCYSNFLPYFSQLNTALNGKYGKLARDQDLSCLYPERPCPDANPIHIP
jgi:hypothetical protein